MNAGQRRFASTRVPGFRTGSGYHTAGVSLDLSCCFFHLGHL